MRFPQRTIDFKLDYQRTYLFMFDTVLSAYCTESWVLSFMIHGATLRDDDSLIFCRESQAP